MPAQGVRDPLVEEIDAALGGSSITPAARLQPQRPRDPLLDDIDAALAAPDAQRVPISPLPTQPPRQIPVDAQPLIAERGGLVMSPLSRRRTQDIPLSPDRPPLPSRPISPAGLPVRSRGVTTTWEPPRTLSAYAENAVRALGAGTLRFNVGFWGGLEATGEVLGMPSVARWAKQTGEEAAKMATGIRGPQAGAGPTERAIYSGFESMGVSVPALVAGAMSGSPVATLALFGGVTGGESYREARAKGVAVPQALGHAVSQGVIEAATEKIPASALLGDLAKSAGLMRMLTRQLASEIPGEQAATVLQDLNDWATLNPDQPFSAYLTARPSAAAQTLIATLVGTLGQTAGLAAVQRAILAAERAQPSPTRQPATDPLVEAIDQALEREAAPPLAPPAGPAAPAPVASAGAAEPGMQPAVPPTAMLDEAGRVVAPAQPPPLPSRPAGPWEQMNVPAAAPPPVAAPAETYETTLARAREENRLARERINAERAARGLPPFEERRQDIGVSPTGAERRTPSDVPRKYSSTQVNLPPAVAQPILEMARRIPDADLAPHGRAGETPDTMPHITVKYGLHTSEAEQVRKVLADEPPITVTLGKTSFFPNAESGSGDVLKVDVESPGLRRLNKKIAEALDVTDTHPTYTPHVTIAYLKPGLGTRYAGDASLDGQTATLDRVVFAAKDGTATEIPLTGQPVRRLTAALAREAPQETALAVIPRQSRAVSGLAIVVGGRRYPVASLREASEKFSQTRDAVEETLGPGAGGASRTPTPIIEQDGQPIGHVSYNGKIWLGPPQAWKSEMVPLYDPYQPQEVSRAPGRRIKPSRDLPEYQEGPGGGLPAQPGDRDVAGARPPVGEAPRPAEAAEGAVEGGVAVSLPEPPVVEWRGPALNTPAFAALIKKGDELAERSSERYRVIQEARREVEKRGYGTKVREAAQRRLAKLQEEYPALAKAADEAKSAAYDLRLQQALADPQTPLEAKWALTEQLAKRRNQSFPQRAYELIRDEAGRQLEALGATEEEAARWGQDLAATLTAYPLSEAGQFRTAIPNAYKRILELRGHAQTEARLRALEQQYGIQSTAIERRVRNAAGAEEQARALQEAETYFKAERERADANEAEQAKKGEARQQARLADARRLQAAGTLVWRNSGGPGAKAEWDPVEGAPVKIPTAPQDLRFVVYKAPIKGEGWYVLEESTGLAVGNGSTRKAAIADATGKAGSQPPARWRETLEAARQGLPPKPSLEPTPAEAQPITEAPKVGEQEEPSALPWTRGGALQQLGARQPRTTALALTRPAPETPQQIAARIAQAIDNVPLAVGKAGRGNRGIFKQSGVIRTAIAEDFSAQLHELGHALDLLITRWSRAHVRDAIAQELKTLGAPTSLPSHTALQRRREGVAEYVRRFLMDPADLAQAAPLTTQAFQTFLSTGHPVAKALQAGQERTLAYLALSPAEQFDLMIQFGSQTPTAVQRLENWAIGTYDDPRSGFDRLTTGLSDGLYRLWQMEVDLQGHRSIDLGESVYWLARILRGSPGQALSFLYGKVRRSDGTILGPGLYEALGSRMQHYQAIAKYMVARRAQRANKLGLVSGFTPAQVKAGLQFGQDPEVQKGAAGIASFREAFLAYLEARGLLTSDLREKWEKRWGDTYIPFHRVGSAIRTSVGGAAVRRNARVPWRRFKGSYAPIADPIASLVEDTFKSVAAAEENAVMLELIEYASQPGAGKWLEVIPADEAPVRFNLQRVKQDIVASLRDAGIEIDDRALLEDDFLDQMVTVWMPHQMTVGNKHYLTALREGKRVWTQIHDEGLWQALTTMGPKEAGAIIRLLRPSASLLRSTATLNLPFMVRNLIRDYASAKFYSPVGYSLKDTVAGFYSVLTKDDSWQLFMASRAGQATFNAQDRNLLQRELRRLGHAPLRKWLDMTVFHPFDGLAALRELTEQATRVGAVRRYLQRTGGVLDEGVMRRIGVLGREVTQDFQKMGQHVREWNGVTAFLGARIGGWTRAAEEARARPVQLGRRVLPYLVLSVALWSLNRDDDEYEEIAGWEKAIYHHVPVPQELRDQGWGPFVRIPRPFEFGDIGNWIEAALDWKATNDPTVRERIPFTSDKELAWNVVLLLTPNLLLPALEVGANYSTFRDRPIVSPYDLGLDSSLQHNRWTSEVAKQLGALMDEAPAKIDHLIYGYTSGIGRMATQAVDDIIGRQRPAGGPRDILGLNALYTGRSFGMSTASINQFYLELEQLQGAADTVRRHLQAGDTERAQQVASEHQLRVEAAGSQIRVLSPRLTALRKRQEALKDLRGEIDRIYRDGRMTPVEKRHALDRLTERMVNLARGGIGRAELQRSKPIRTTPSAAAVGAR